MWIISSFKNLINKFELKNLKLKDTYTEDFNINKTFIDDNNLEKTLLDYLYTDLIDEENLYLKNSNENLILDNHKNYNYLNKLKLQEIKDYDDKEINAKEIIKGTSLDLNNTKINDIFNDNKYIMFKHFCEQVNINYIEEITEDTLIKFCNTPGAGIKKINDLKKSLSELFLNYFNLKYNIFSINFIFCENEFKYFRIFCKKNKIYYIDHINEFFLNKFKEEDKVSKKLIFVINERINFSIKERNSIKTLNKEYKEKIFLKTYWYNILKEFNINFIMHKLGIDEDKIDYKIDYLQNKFKNDLDKNTDFITILNVINFLNEINSPEEIVKNIDVILEDEREKRIFFKRYNNNKTLEEIGVEEELTRERVRQILKKADDTLSSFLNINKFNIALKLKYINKDMCSLKDLHEIFGQDKIFYINSLIKMNDIGLSFVESLNLIVFKTDNTLDEKIKMLIESLPETFKLCNYIDILIYKLKEIDIKEIDVELLKDLLSTYGFNIYGEYCFKNKITIIKACELIFKEYLTYPLRIDSKGINIIRNLVYDHLNMTLDSNDRAIESRIREIESVLLVDKLTFVHISHINTNKKTILYLKNLLEQSFKEKEILNSGYLFENNKELMIKNNINNKYMLYSLIHYYYGKSYSIGKGNTLDIYKDKINTISL